MWLPEVEAYAEDWIANNTTMEVFFSDHHDNVLRPFFLSLVPNGEIVIGRTGFPNQTVTLKNVGDVAEYDCGEFGRYEIRLMKRKDDEYDWFEMRLRTTRIR